jgi:hypothetical protein
MVNLAVELPESMRMLVAALGSLKHQLPVPSMAGRDEDSRRYRSRKNSTPAYKCRAHVGTGVPQFGDQLPLIDQVLRTGFPVGERDGIGIDAELFVDCGESVLSMRRAIVSELTSTICRAD